MDFLMHVEYGASKYSNDFMDHIAIMSHIYVLNHFSGVDLSTFSFPARNYLRHWVTC